MKKCRSPGSDTRGDVPIGRVLVTPRSAWLAFLNDATLFVVCGGPFVASVIRDENDSVFRVELSHHHSSIWPSLDQISSCRIDQRDARWSRSLIRRRNQTATCIIGVGLRSTDRIDLEYDVGIPVQVVLRGSTKSNDSQDATPEVVESELPILHVAVAPRADASPLLVVGPVDAAPGRTGLSNHQMVRVVVSGRAADCVDD